VENCSEGGALLIGNTSHLRETARIALSIQGFSAPLTGFLLSVRKDTAHVKFDLTLDVAAAYVAEFKHAVAGKVPLVQAA
jgi:hypothetical protein